MKKLIPLLFVMAVAFVAAPEAQACANCYYHPDYSYCQWNWPFGMTECYDTSEGCVLAGEDCWSGGGLAPLSSEFRIVSVERIDEAKQPAETLVARVEVVEEATKR